MQVYIEREGRQLQMKFKGTVAELLEQLKINKGTVLVTRDNELLTSDEKVEDADEIRILSVISGG